MSVRLTGIEKTFRRARPPAHALRGVTLEVARGRCLAILGPSGSGKTTLLRVAAGLERPDAGRVFFEDRDVTEMRAERRRAGVVFAEDALFPHMTIAANIGYGMPRERRRAGVEAIAARMRIGELLDRRPHALSTGQRQRAAVARALATEPDVLLLDEPFSRLDAPLRAELRAEFARVLRGADVTTLFVTHDQSEAMALGDRIAVMRDGRIEQTGTQRDLYERPINTFVARFVGTPAMSIVPATALESRAGCVAQYGLRAGAVRIAARGAFAGVVGAVEDLGDRAYAQVELPFGMLCAVVDPPLPSPGERVCIEIDLAQAYAFAESGELIADLVRA